MISKLVRRSRAAGVMPDRSAPQASQVSTAIVSLAAIFRRSAPVSWPGSFAPDLRPERAAVSSLSSIRDGGMPEFLPVFGVVFSRRMEVRMPGRVIGTRIADSTSPDSFPAVHRRHCPASTAMTAASTARRSPGGIAA